MVFSLCSIEYILQFEEMTYTVDESSETVEICLVLYGPIVSNMLEVAVSTEDITARNGGRVCVKCL